MKNKLLILFAILTLIALSFCCWFFLQKKESTQADTLAVQKTKASNNLAKTLPASDSSITESVDTKLIDENLDITDNERRLREMEAGVALSDIPGALRFLQSQKDSDAVRALMVSLVRQWAEGDARSAAKWAESMPRGNARTEALTTVAIVLVNQDIDESMRWVRNLPKGEDRDSAIKYASYEIAMTEPVTALKLAIDELPANEERNELIKYASLQWASVDPEATMLWADQITDESLRESALVNVATAWSENDPASAAKFAMQMIEPGRAHNDAVISIVQRWVQTDSDAATAWVETFPEGVLLETAKEIINNLKVDK